MPSRKNQRSPVVLLGCVFALLLVANGQLKAFQLPLQLQQPSGFLQSGMMNPRLNSNGEWVEVVTVTNKWIVVQNERGQQFPVSTDSIRQSFIRWPVTLDRIRADALLEVTGIDLGTNQIRADQVDVYEGSVRNLVAPTVEQIVGYNRVFTPFDIESMNIYGVDLYRFLLPGEDQMPNRVHIVGPLVGANPLRIAVPGNIDFMVFPSIGGIYLSLITPGTPSFIKPGDLAYATVDSNLPKTLVLDQLVVYKKIPMHQFAP